MENLEIHRRYLAMDEHLTPETRALLVSLGAGMTDIIYSTYINETAKRAQQALNDLKDIAADVQMIDQSWPSKANHNVQLIHSVLHEAGLLSKVEGGEKERPIPVNSSAGASSSGMKRKANGDHPDDPPSVRQELTAKDPEQLSEAERLLLFDNDVAAGASHSVHQAALYADIFSVDGSSSVQAEHQALAKAAEGGSRLGTEEEVTLPAEWWSPGELLNMDIGDGLLDIPIDDELPDMMIGDQLFDMTIGDISLPAPAFALCVSELHQAAEYSITDDSVAFDTWASS